VVEEGHHAKRREARRPDHPASPLKKLYDFMNEEPDLLMQILSGQQMSRLLLYMLRRRHALQEGAVDGADRSACRSLILASRS
jgi:hypothetical protein